MRNLLPRPAFFVCLAFASRSHYSAFARQATGSEPMMLVTWFASGAIALPAGQGWKPEMINVYDEGRRPVAQFSNRETGLTASFILFESLSGKASAQGCRDDAFNPILEHDAKLISKRADGELKTTVGGTLATTSYLIEMTPPGGHHQRNLFGIAGNDKICAEMHISSVVETPAEEDKIKAALVDFRPTLTYQPNAVDHFRLASVLFKASPTLAPPYYKASRDAMPAPRRNGSTCDVPGNERKPKGESCHRREGDCRRSRLPDQLLQHDLHRRGIGERDQRKDPFTTGL